MLKQTILYQTLSNILNINPYQILFNILSDEGVQNYIEELNRNQLLDGENSLGVKLSDIGGEYSEVTLFLHPEKVRDRVNLYDTGEFHNSIQVNPQLNKGFEIQADPIKTNDNGTKTNLYERWGEDVIGLQNENLQSVIDKLLEQIKTQILQQIQLNT